jgi:DNA-binding response OmpR family regulator
MWILKGVRVADKILVIDDDPNVAELIKLILKPRGLLIYHAINGQEGLKQAYELQPDLVILDIMMPEQDGYEVCARLRELSDVPIVMLTAKSQSSDVTRGFAVGADDYVKKPFSNDELVSRIESLLRRKKSNDASTNITGYSDGLLEVEFSTQKVTLMGEEIALTPTEFKLLAFMIRHPQKTLSTRTLLAEVWGNAYSHDKALLSLYVHQVRQKLKEEETEHAYIKTHWGQGYWFNPLPQANKAAPVLPVTEEEEEEDIAVDVKQEPKPSIQFLRNKWIWVAVGVLAGLSVLAILLNTIFREPPASPTEGHTAIEAPQVTAEGFAETDSTGVRGQICVRNKGDSPTENLSIVNTVQISSTSTAKSISSTVDLSQNPILGPGQSDCYLFELAFEPDPDQNTQYRITTMITITNHTGLLAGSKYCPGPQPCPYGPEITSEVVLPKK